MEPIRSTGVQVALKAKSDEERRNNSFALGVLRLNLVDPAMGSGHFLVRATEWLAEQIVYQLSNACLRFHRVASALYRGAHKRVFFEPRLGTWRLFEKFNEPVKKLVGEWWEKIETSQKFAANHAQISGYHKKLKPGDVTLVGLIAEGGQGLATANNARFLGHLQGTPPAEKIKASREEWTKRWLADAQIKTMFLAMLAQSGGDAARAAETPKLRSEPFRHRSVFPCKTAGTCHPERDPGLARAGTDNKGPRS